MVLTISNACPMPVHPRPNRYHPQARVPEARVHACDLCPETPDAGVQLARSADDPRQNIADILGVAPIDTTDTAAPAAPMDPIASTLMRGEDPVVAERDARGREGASKA